LHLFIPKSIKIQSVISFISSTKQERQRRRMEMQRMVRQHNWQRRERQHIWQRMVKLHSWQRMEKLHSWLHKVMQHSWWSKSKVKHKRQLELYKPMELLILV